MAGPTGGTTGPPWQDNTVPLFPVCLLTVHLYTTAAAAAVTRSLFVCP